jgi:hypothetical protein
MFADLANVPETSAAAMVVVGRCGVETRRGQDRVYACS